MAKCAHRGYFFQTKQHKWVPVYNFIEENIALKICINTMFVCLHFSAIEIMFTLQHDQVISYGSL